MNKVLIIVWVTVLLSISSFTRVHQTTANGTGNDCALVQKKLKRLIVKVSLSPKEAQTAHRLWVKTMNLEALASKSGCKCKDAIKNIKQAKSQALKASRQMTEEMVSEHLDEMLTKLNSAETELTHCNQ
jgi:hypothetical protein